jgi:guanidinoacetate N-methyltransferase
MTRKSKRTDAFDLTLDVRDDAFIRPPNEGQRNWLLNRFIREAAADLQALDVLARRFVPGGARDFTTDRRTADLTDEEIMEDWQFPLMAAMAEVAARTRGDVLEIGFGRGISADLIQQRGVRSHTIIECNDSVIRRFASWRASRPDRDIRLVRGLWQDVIAPLGAFDAVFFHTYALDEDEAIDFLANSVTFAAHFFAVAAAHLRPGGVFTYLTNEVDCLSRAHQRLLFEHFSTIRLQRVALSLPPDVRDAWWADSMIVIEAVR